MTVRFGLFLPPPAVKFAPVEPLALLRNRLVIDYVTTRGHNSLGARCSERVATTSPIKNKSYRPVRGKARSVAQFGVAEESRGEREGICGGLINYAPGFLAGT